MSERITLTVEDGTNEKLIRLAGGQRRRGAWLSEMVAAAFEFQAGAIPATDAEATRLSLLGLAAELQMVKGRLITVEKELAALIARTAER